MTQARISQFADVIDDRQWLHVDTERAALESPFKGTVAHGFLTLSLLTALGRTAVCFPTMAMSLNYGFNRVRFVAPVPAESRIRGRFSLMAVEEAGGATQVTWRVDVERAGGGRPCCVAEWVVRYYPDAAGSDG